MIQNCGTHLKLKRSFTSEEKKIATIQLCKIIAEMLVQNEKFMEMIQPNK